MEKLKVVELFAGVGGFSLGLERTGGFETVAFCEISKFSQKVLRKHWPEVPIHDDVKKLTMEMEGVSGADVVTAGFPCQDVSYAGKGAGLAGERSGLWWMVRRTLRLVRPRIAVLENVAALLNRGMGTVLGSMAQIGYDAEWHCIRASRIGLPHPRDRLWVIANPQRKGWQRPLTDHGLSCSQITPHPLTGHDAAIKWLELEIDKQGIRESDGVSVKSHRDRISALGNAVVPAVVEMLGVAILEAEACDKKLEITP